jgi:hypothetical protein
MERHGVRGCAGAWDKKCLGGGWGNWSECDR